MRCPRERNPLMGRASGRRTFHPRFVLIERECETRNFLSGFGRSGSIQFDPRERARGEGESERVRSGTKDPFQPIFSPPSLPLSPAAFHIGFGYAAAAKRKRGTKGEGGGGAMNRSQEFGIGTNSPSRLVLCLLMSDMEGKERNTRCI